MKSLINLYSTNTATNKTIKRIFKEQGKNAIDEPDCSIGDPVRNENNGSQDDLGEKMVAWMKRSDGNYTRFTKASDILHVFIVLDDILYVLCKREEENFAPRKNVIDFHRIILSAIHNLCKDIMNEKLANIDRPIATYIDNIKRGWATLEALPESKAAAATLKAQVEEARAEEEQRKANFKKRFNNYSKKLREERLAKGGKRQKKRKTRKLRR